MCVDVPRAGTATTARKRTVGPVKRRWVVLAPRQSPDADGTGVRSILQHRRVPGDVGFQQRCDGRQIRQSDVRPAQRQRHARDACA